MSHFLYYHQNKCREVLKKFAKEVHTTMCTNTVVSPKMLLCILIDCIEIMLYYSESLITSPRWI